MCLQDVVKNIWADKQLACHSFQYMHSQNIMHRDLKTQNIFLTKNRIIKVGDLGIARWNEFRNPWKQFCISKCMFIMNACHYEWILDSINLITLQFDEIWNYNLKKNLFNNQ